MLQNKRIVLYDTLLKQVTTSEIVAILGHEIGHWKVIDPLLLPPFLQRLTRSYVSSCGTPCKAF